MADKQDPIWWIEVIKISPGLVSALLAVAIVVAYRREVRALFARMTKFKALGVEAEFSAKAMDGAIAAQGVQVSQDDRKGALKRLALLAPLLRDTRILWVDDTPASTRNERALLESYGVRVDTFTTSAQAESALRDNKYLLVITDLKREGRDDEGLQFVARTLASKTYVWVIAYVGTDQRGKARPADLFGITNRPDHLMHLVCDVVAREKM
jgi:CheY-like chemotaxis protein